MVLRVIPLLKQLKWVALGISVSFALVLASAGNPDLERGSPISETKDSNRAAVAAQKRSTSIESEIITATGRGFEPGEITRPEGKFILMIDNLTATELDFRLSRDNGQPLHEIRSTREEPDWNEILDLRPGRYVLTERSHPQWTCSVTITAR